MEVTHGIRNGRSVPGECWGQPPGVPGGRALVTTVQLAGKPGRPSPSQGEAGSKVGFWGQLRAEGQWVCVCLPTTVTPSHGSQPEASIITDLQGRSWAVSGAARAAAQELLDLSGSAARVGSAAGLGRSLLRVVVLLGPENDAVCSPACSVPSSSPWTLLSFPPGLGGMWDRALARTDGPGGCQSSVPELSSPSASLTL